MSMPSKLKLLVKFQFQYIIDSETNCWNWIHAPRSKNGYGEIWCDNKHHLAHRISYYLNNDTFDETLNVLHTCDNNRCVNPAHLYQGTFKDNAQDRENRNRRTILKGIDNNKAKIDNEQDIIDIRNKYSNGSTTQELEKEYTLSRVQIGNIVTGRQWKHVEGPIVDNISRLKAKLDSEDFIEIRKKSNYMKQRDIAKEYNVSQSTIWKIVNYLYPYN